jgi:hypothetical protein
MSGVRLSDFGAAPADTASIAAAVAAALTIPTAAQNAAATAAVVPNATQVQTACGVAITAASLATATSVAALPSAADVATAVGAQAACEAAIAAKTSDLVSAVAAGVPDATEIQAAAVAAIQAECGQFGSIRGVVDPSTYTLASGELTGATSYVLQFFQANKRCIVWGFVITSDAVTTLQWRSGLGATIGDKHTLAVNVPWEVSPGGKKSYKMNLEDALFILSSNSAAKLHITYWFSYEDF